MSTRVTGTLGVMVVAAACSWLSGCATAPGGVPQCTGKSVPINAVPRDSPAGAAVTERESDAQRQ